MDVKRVFVIIQARAVGLPACIFWEFSNLWPLHLRAMIYRGPEGAVV